MTESQQPPPTIGSQVFYRLSGGPCEGQQRPALVVSSRTTPDAEPVLHLCVFIDPVGDDPLYEMRGSGIGAVLARSALEGTGVGEWQRELDLVPGEVAS